MMSFVWIVIGIFNLPTWALEHAKAPMSCEAFSYNYIDTPETWTLSIGHCSVVVTDRIIDNGRFIGSSTLEEVGTMVTYRKPMPDWYDTTTNFGGTPLQPTTNSVDLPSGGSTP